MLVLYGTGNRTGLMGVLPRRAIRAAGRPPVWLGMALVLDAAITITAISPGRSVKLSGLLGVAPLLICARYGGRMTALAAGYALALCGVVTMVANTSVTGTSWRFGTAAAAGTLAVLVAVIRTRRESALIHISENVQRAILRPLPAELGGVAFACHYQSATTGATVGGDLYDITMTQFGPRFIIGDVKGKGLDAVGRCAAVLAVFRELAFAEADLAMLAEQMDARLSPDMGIEDFVTVILAEFAPGEVRIVNCGHPPPVTVTPGAAGLQFIAPEHHVPPLGLQPHPVRQDIALKPGDRLLFYTDGLVETRDRAGRFLHLDHHVAAALAAPDLNAAIRRMVRLHEQHVGGARADDVLLVLSEPVELV
jgi:sigma-B regulation protein RsbU (phosphoserine phosphatase)